jgi:ABC-type Zn uptake system ZnuABC Zn-binding protein ZnuA
MRRTLFVWLIAAAAASCLLFGCQGKKPAPRSRGRVIAVCTISVVEDLVKNVGGELVETSALVTGLENPHTFSPTPADSKMITRADLFFEVGLGLEPWAKGLLDASGNKDLRVAVLSKGIKTIAAGLAEEEEEGGTHGLSEGEHSHHGGANPHVWMDPDNGLVMVDSIARELSDVDPDHARQYRANAAEYKEKLLDLGRKIKSRSAQLQNRSVATHAPAFSYLLRFMGLSEAVRVQLTAAEEPPAKRIAEIVKEMKRQGGVKVLLTMPQYSNVIPDEIAQETGAKLVYVTPLLTDDPDNNTYLKMIETTATKIIDALQSSKPD